ncbi:hypothetical protein BCR39DRAFT_363589 [Naematelia encephala]|uniref:Uncharacterized protein n=1 Tax=Naematelia encephala TaxID=71784 RepID=A0A1Y2AKS9_9TREE|nr:hypothetical protein BCR39DRAFT_363589 [Naematelia encephala]
MTVNVVVAGSARGIGFELAKQLSSKPNHVVHTVDRYLSTELEDLIKTSKNVHFSLADITDIDQLQNASGLVPHVDLLLCVAGVLGCRESLLGRPASEEEPAADIMNVFRVNLLGTWNVIAAYQEKLARGAKVMLMSSTRASLQRADSDGDPAYSIAKAGLNMLGRKLAVGLSDRGIDVIMMSPGVVKTEMNGWEGEITPEESVNGILQQLAKDGTSGMFLRYNGEIVPW